MDEKCFECGKTFYAEKDEFGEYPDICRECEIEWARIACVELLPEDMR